MTQFKTYIILCILPIFMCANHTDMPDASNAMDIKDPFEKEWEQVEDLESKGLPESALKIVEEIQEAAKKVLDKDQIIKTIVYKAKYLNQLNEDGAIIGIAYIESEYEEAPRPIKNILASQLAELYYSYLNQHQWQIQDRTTLDQDSITDMRIWTMDRLVEKITELHLFAVSDTRLQKNNLKEFEYILNDADDENLRPMLYDLLAHRAIDYFSDTRTFLTEPVNVFILDSEDYWTTSKKFSRLNIEGPENNSKKYNALQLFQNAIKYQLKSKNPEALVDLEVKRFKFLKEHSVLNNKETLYTDALNKLYKDNKKKGGELALLALALHHYQKDNLPEADQICKQILEDFGTSKSSKSAESIQSNIRNKNFSLEGEEIYLPKNALLFKATFRNIKNLNYFLVEVSPEELENFDKTKHEDKIRFLRKLKATTTGSIALPLYQDFKTHSVEFGIDALDKGRYIMVISDDGKFDNSQNTGTHLIQFQVSNLGVWSRKTFEGKNSLVVTNRSTGSPIEGVKAHFSIFNLASKSWKHSLTVVSDSDGFVLPDLPERMAHKVYFEHKGDLLYLNDNIHQYLNEDYNQGHQEVKFFTDRSLYRPGQTIHFKGMALQYDKNHVPSLLMDQKISVQLYDANGQKVESQSLTSNNFGTFHGQFTAPEGGLNGSMSLRSDIGGSARIQVEEYKRPTFEVNFDTIIGSYQPGDKINVTGQILAYAGFGVDDANLEIRVTKRQKFFYFPWWRRGWMPQNESTKEILLTQIQSDQEGKFELNFESEIDNEEDKFIFYEYVIHIDATNQAGETRSGEEIVALSKHPFQLSTSIQQQENLDSLKSIEVVAKNFSGQLVDVVGMIKITALTSPEITFIEKYWSKADSILFDKEDYNQKFPHYPYGVEDQVANWAETETVFSQKFGSKNGSISIDPMDWGPGYYKIQIEAQDEQGRRNTLTSYFEIFDLKDEIIPYNTSLWQFLVNKDYEPGETVNYHLGTAEDRLPVLFEVVKNRELLISKWVELVDLDKIEFEIRPEDRGNLTTYVHYAAHNRSHSIQHQIRVPWTNKDLAISLSTYRDKTKPGSKEEWTIAVKFPENVLSEVELLATMYDASLDAILPHNWYFRGFPNNNYSNYNFYFSSWRGTRSRQLYHNWISGGGISTWSYPVLEWFDYPIYGNYRNVGFREKSMQDGPIVAMSKMVDGAAPESLEMDMESPDSDKKELYIPPQDLRENLNETVFFLPELLSDSDGRISLSFTMNEALTRWKFLAFGHTTDLAYGQVEQLITTQKELMVIPHLPRFLRQGDKISIATTAKNLTPNELSGEVQLKLFDAISGEELNDQFKNSSALQSFSLEGGSSGAYKWQIEIPQDYTSVVRYEIIAVADDFSDGQTGSLPVVSNRMLVTETLPLWANGNEKREFTFESLLKDSDTKTHHNLTVELTSNPIWYAIQSLPYIMEYPYECTEQLFNRFFANVLGTSIVAQYPKIKSAMAQWEDSEAMLSNLSKNQALKSAILEETPWVRDALSEEEQKKNLALFFDVTRMSKEREADKRKLIQRQGPDGSFGWFNGGNGNTYITQYILEGIGQLNHLDIINSSRDKGLNAIVAKSIDFVDAQAAERYAKLKKAEQAGQLSMSDNNLSAIDIHYLYARSYFEARKMTREASKAFFYYKGQIEKYWVKRNLYEQAMIGLTMEAFEEDILVAEIIASLTERALESEELGMYWKFNSGYHWSQMPIETQSLMIQLFDLYGSDNSVIDEMKKWLIKNKQTNRWSTTKATASALHALMRTGSKWIDETQPVELTLGSQEISKMVDEKEYGSGYYKKIIDSEEIDKSFAQISINNSNSQPSFGAVYYQYWEDMDAIGVFEETPLILQKSIFKKVNTESGPELKAISDSERIEIGDKVTIRIELEVDRAMEFVHMKDSRSSGMEPEDVISEYKWQDGLGYYQSTKDVSTNFFFDFLPRGKYVFEYNVRASHSGNFSNGITTIQCMYAPEFTSHSEGIKVEIE